jgi:Zn finger protein HypA/HybF involved in hydrogenase expression
VNTKTPVLIGCKEHGYFKQTPDTHKRGVGCPKCGSIKSSSYRLCNQDDVIKDFREVHNDTYNYDKVEYVNTKTPVLIGCKEHGYFEQIPHSHKIGIGCPKCGYEKTRLNTLCNQDDVIKDFREVHNDTYNYDKVEYVNSNTPVLIGCKEHGYFEQIPHSHKIGKGCSKCSRLKSRFYNKTLAERNKEEYLNTFCTVYLLNFSNKDEIFHKIGISNNYKRRIVDINRDSNKEYKIVLLDIIETNLYNAIYIEENNLSLYEKYEPNVYFSGRTECVKGDNITKIIV